MPQLTVLSDFLVLPLLAATGAYSIGDLLCVWMSSTFFSNCYSSNSFCRILTKLGTYNLCSNMHKTVEQVFESLILKFLANFKNFTFRLSLCSSSSIAI